jgi:glucose-1-phosphate adenylyltransferase
MAKPKVLGIVLAGGEGKRLWPLTADRAKPAVPFGGNFRLIDFVLSNLVNAGYLRICVLTQYKSHSLDRHITTTWRMSQLIGNYVTPVPAQQRLGPRWYTGSADAILQSLNLVYDESPDYLVVFGADHVYRMDPSQMVKDHIDTGAEATVAGIRVPRKDATAFGVIQTADDGINIAGFLEKPADPPSVPDDPDVTYASMGNYVFSTDALIEALKVDAADETSVHDMGGNIIPYFVNRGTAHVYDFARNEVPGTTDRDRGYWRDVGTLDAYHDAHMDLVSLEPIFNLYNREWPILSFPATMPPAKFVEDRQRNHHLRSEREPVGDLRRRAHRHGQPHRGFGHPAGCADRPRRRGPARHPRQECRRPGRCQGRGRRRHGQRPLHRQRRRHHRRGQGHHDRQVARTTCDAHSLSSWVMDAGCGVLCARSAPRRCAPAMLTRCQPAVPDCRLPRSLRSSALPAMLTRCQPAAVG